MELWELSKQEYIDKYGKPRENTTVTSGFDAHKSAVEIAVNRGRILPENVLIDYPEFREASRKNFLLWLQGLSSN